MTNGPFNVTFTIQSTEELTYYGAWFFTGGSQSTRRVPTQTQVEYANTGSLGSISEPPFQQCTSNNPDPFFIEIPKSSSNAKTLVTWQQLSPLNTLGKPWLIHRSTKSHDHQPCHHGYTYLSAVHRRLQFILCCCGKLSEFIESVHGVCRCLHLFSISTLISSNEHYFMLQIFHEYTS